MSFWYFAWKKEAEVGDMGGFWLAAGIAGGAVQTCSPSSAMGTGWWHVEHLTDGRIWDMRPGSGPATAREDAIRSVGE